MSSVEVGKLPMKSYEIMFICFRFGTVANMQSILHNNIPPKKMVCFSCTVFISDSQLTSQSPFANQGASSLLQRHQRQNPTPGDFLERGYCGENIMMLEHRDEADFLKLHIWNMFLEVSSRCWYLQK